MKKDVNKKLDRLVGIKIAHRGLWNDVNPENSLGAYKRCIDKNVPIELDVQILKDGTLICFHDNNTFRMTGEDLILKEVSYDDIKNLKLKDTKYGIPKFSDVLEIVDGKVLLDIEIKGNGKDFRICHEICKYLDRYKGDFLIKSFNPMYMIWFRIYRSDYLMGLLIPNLSNQNRFSVLKYIFLMLFVKPDFIAIDYRNLSNKKIDRLRKCGVSILIFTLKERDLKKYKGVGYIYEE